MTRPPHLALVGICKLLPRVTLQHPERHYLGPLVRVDERAAQSPVVRVQDLYPVGGNAFVRCKARAEYEGVAVAQQGLEDG